MRVPVFAAALVVATPGLAQTPDATQIVAAERAFAADAPALGLTASFNKWAVPDAVMIAGGQVRTVREVFPPDVPRPADEIRLAWWPNFAGISASGDLGFTTGGVAVDGRRTVHYFTIWMRQPGGDWRWVYDGGSGASAETVPGPDTEPVILPVSTQPSVSPGIAFDEVSAVEYGLAREAEVDQKSAHLAALADNGRLYVAPLAPAVGGAAFADALDAWPPVFNFGPTLGGGASAAGDMVWTYGTAAWTQYDLANTGHYVRLWQKQGQGWRIVLALLIPAPPPPAPPAGG